MKKGCKVAYILLEFEGASKKLQLVGQSEVKTKFNYFYGNNPRLWYKGIPSYKNIVYKEIYPGINLKVREISNKIEYDLFLSPNSDPQKVKIKCYGVNKIKIDKKGNLILETNIGNIVQKKPKTWQTLSTRKKCQIECNFEIINDKTFTFKIKKTSKGLPIIIDPGVEWGSFFGGNKNEEIHAIDIDKNDIITIAGWTESANTFPRTFGSFKFFYNGGFSDGFVAKLDPTKKGQNQLLWCTFFGGDREDYVENIKVVQSGDIYMTGYTDSTNFPIPPNTNPFQNKYKGKGQKQWDGCFYCSP